MKSCTAWLHELLTKNNNAMLVSDVRQKAKEMGFKKSELKQAKKELNIKTFHQFDDDGDTENWFWCLP